MLVLTHLQRTRLRRALPKLLASLGVVFVITGVIGTVLFQSYLRETSQDTRSSASIADGTVFIRSPQNGQSAAFAPDSERVLQLEIRTQLEQITEVHLVFNIITNIFEPPLLSTPDSSPVRIVSQELERTSDGYLVSSRLQPKTGDAFTAADWQPLLELYYTPLQGGRFTLAFDAETSKATAVDSQDKLKHIDTVSYSISGGTQQSTNSQSDQSSTLPLPPGVGGPAVDLCNSICSSNRDCGLNQRCYDTGSDKRCRVVSNVSSPTCATTVAPGTGSCNSSCSTSSECSAELSCWYGLCRNPLAADDPSCSVPTPSAAATRQTSCNTSCNSNDDCAVNLRCYVGSCRLATNPSSTSCSAATAATVSPLYPNKGGVVGEISLEDEPVLPTPNLTVSPTPEATAVTVTSTPAASVSAGIESTGEETDASASSLLDTILSEITSAALPTEQVLPYIVLGVGVLLLIGASFFLLKTSKKTSAPTAQAPQNTQAQNPAVPQPPESPAPALPALPHSPVPRSQTHLGVQPSAAPPQHPTPLSHASPGTPLVSAATPSPGTTPTPTTSLAPATSTSMLDRMKSKGITPPGS